MTETIALTLTLLLVPTGVALVLLHSRLLRLMRAEHVSVWESLGRPKLVFAKTISETLKTLRYLWRRDYVTLEDYEFVALCRRLRFLHIVFPAIIVVAAILFTVVAYFVGSHA